MTAFLAALRRVGLVSLCVLAQLAPGAAAPRQSDRVERAEALRVFSQRVEAYAALHRRLEGPLPPLTPTRETLRNQVARQLLANSIRKARAGARQGDIFDARIATVFRHIIAEALAGRDVEALLTELHDEHPDMHGVSPVVNEPLPEGATHHVPCVLLAALPVLPEDVEYRIVDHDLALWDVHANLVVDFVPDALAPGTTRSDRP